MMTMSIRNRVLSLAADSASSLCISFSSYGGDIQNARCHVKAGALKFVGLRRCGPEFSW
jgi:hypothetical protein